MNRKIFIILVFFAIVLFHSLSFAGLSVDPVTLEIVAQKGEDKLGVIKVKNTSEKLVRIRVSPEKWDIKDLDINKWLTIEPKEFELASAQLKEVSYRINPPEDSIGELRCMVFFISDEIGKKKSPVGIRFGVPFYVVVGGTEVIEVEVDSINVKYDINRNILDGTIMVNNKSNIHIRPHVKVYIYDNKDKLINRFSLPYGQPAQKEQLRPFIFQQELELDPGRYKLVAMVDYGKLYGLKGKIAEVETEFLVESPQEKAVEEKEVTSGVSKDEAEK